MKWTEIDAATDDLFGDLIPFLTILLKFQTLFIYFLPVEFYSIPINIIGNMARTRGADRQTEGKVESNVPLGDKRNFLHLEAIFIAHNLLHGA